MMVGCGQSTEKILDVSPETPTSTAISTKLPASALTHPPAYTPAPSLVPSHVPTLSTEDAFQRLLSLLASNGSCHLPCLWGITPGKSINMGAQNILMPMSSIASPETTYFGPLHGIFFGAIQLRYTEKTLHFNVNLGYDTFPGSDIVRGIRFQMDEEQIDTKDEYGNPIKTPIFDSKVFQDRTNYYSLAHLLSEQGIPSEVWFQAWGPLTAGVIDIAILYPDQGIWVNYTMKNIASNGVVKRGCPVNSLIEMQLFPAGDSASFFSLLNKTDWGVTQSGYLALEKATSLSLQEFYETFRIPTQECIETPITLWPTPEGGDARP